MSEAMPSSPQAPTPSASADGSTVGKIVSINGTSALVLLQGTGQASSQVIRPQIGAVMGIETDSSVVLAIIAAMSSPAGAVDANGEHVRLVELELIGECTKATNRGPSRFRPGVSTYPTLDDPVHIATRQELAALFAVNGSANVRVGAVRQDMSIPATVAVNELFSRHCAIIGATGAGKSCAMALMVRAVLERYTQAHMVIFDPHNEYKACFDEMAVSFDTDNLVLPYWMMTFEELIGVLYPERTHHESEIELLADLLLAAKRANTASAFRSHTVRRGVDSQFVTLDTPLPYRISDVIAQIDKMLGALDSASPGPLKRLKARLQSVTQDSRYNFIFARAGINDNMAEILGEIFRVPVNGAPVSLIELGGMAQEVAQVVVAVISRLAYEFGIWGGGETPIALICEEAHRYAPRQSGASNNSLAALALSRIAKEGRKCGVALWVSTQRPTELDPAILSQCNTIFAMRLSNQQDQEALQAAVPDASTSLLSCLSSLNIGEAIAIGEGVALPTRMRFDPLPRENIPTGKGARFSDAWSSDREDEGQLVNIVNRWRFQKFDVS